MKDKKKGYLVNHNINKKLRVSRNTCSFFIKNKFKGEKKNGKLF